MDDRVIAKFLKHLAAESAPVILEYFNHPDLRIEWKGDNTPVTYADKKAEEIIRSLIESEFPDHGIIGEEFGSLAKRSEYDWVIDPIDGTKAYATGCPLFGTLACLRQNQEPLWGMINIPVTGQLFIGNGSEAWCNDVKCRIRETEALERSFVLASDPKTPALHRNPQGWQQLLDATDQFRSWGDCFGYAMLLNGSADIMCDPILAIWDLVPLLPILRGAGVAVSDWHGDKPETGDSLIACHPRHHAEVIRLLNP